jgi:hypothetical protein
MKISTILVGALAAVTCSAHAQNLVVNGSFEDSGMGFFDFAGWEDYDGAGPAGLPEVTPQDGNTCVKMFGNFGGGENTAVALQVVEGVTPGETYTLSCYANHLSVDAINGGNVAVLSLQFRDSGDNIIEAVDADAVSPTGTPTDEWRLIEVSGIAPANTDNIQVVLVHVQFDGVSPGASFWDNVSLTEGGGGPLCDNPADINGDGVLNFSDVTSFLTQYSMGCP